MYEHGWREEVTSVVMYMQRGIVVEENQERANFYQ